MKLRQKYVLLCGPKAGCLYIGRNFAQFV